LGNTVVKEEKITWFALECTTHRLITLFDIHSNSVRHRYRSKKLFSIIAFVHLTFQCLTTLAIPFLCLPKYISLEDLQCISVQTSAYIRSINVLIQLVDLQHWLYLVH